MSAEIAITRPPAVWRDALRTYKLMVDGQPLASVSSDESQTVVVREGAHHVWLELYPCRSRTLTVDLRDGERAVLSCRPNGPLLLALLFTTVLRSRYIAVQLERIEPATLP